MGVQHTFNLYRKNKLKFLSQFLSRSVQRRPGYEIISQTVTYKAKFRNAQKLNRVWAPNLVIILVLMVHIFL